MTSGMMEQKVVIFRVGREEYAVAIDAVREVGPWLQPTPVPEAPDIVEGVIDLRGEIIPVIDLGRRFGSGRARAAADARIMVMEVHSRLVGFVVDDVTEVFSVAPGAISAASPLLRRNPSDPMVVGILKVSEGRLVIMIDAARVLSEDMLDF